MGAVPECPQRAGASGVQLVPTWPGGDCSMEPDLLGLGLTAWGGAQAPHRGACPGLLSHQGVILLSLALNSGQSLHRSQSPAPPAMGFLENEGSWSLSFAGSGYLGLYHVGVTQCLHQRAPHLLKGARRIYGSSSGVLNAVSIICGMSTGECWGGQDPLLPWHPGGRLAVRGEWALLVAEGAPPRGPDYCCSSLLGLVKQLQQLSLGILHPAYAPIEYIKQQLKDALPSNGHILATQRLGISLTHWPDGRNYIVTDFATRDELIQVSRCWAQIWGK